MIDFCDTENYHEDKMPIKLDEKGGRNMDRIIETYDITLRGDGEAQQRIRDKERLSIIQALDEIGITYIDIGTPERGKELSPFYREVQSLTLNNAIPVPFLRALDCDEAVNTDEVVNLILQLETAAVCIEGECSEHLLRSSGLRPDENLWRISSIISWFRSRGKTVIFNAGNFFDALEASSGYTKEVLKTAIHAGADRIVLCDNNGYALPHDILSALAVVDSMRAKRVGICCGNASGCADASAIEAARHGVMHIQGTFLGTGVPGGATCLAATIVNLQLSMGYHCIQDIKMNRLTHTAEYIAEQTNSTVSANTPFVGRDAFSRDIVVVPRARTERVSPEMVGNSRRANVTTSSGISALLEKLRALGYKISKEQLLQLQCMQHQEKASYIPEVSMILRVLREMGKLEGLYTIHSMQIHDNLLLSCNHADSTVVLETTVGGEHNLDVYQGPGLHAAIAGALVKAVGRKFPSVRGIRITNIRGRYSADTTRYSLVCDITNGERSYSLLTSGNSVSRCMFEAVRDAVDLQLLIQGYYKEIV